MYRYSEKKNSNWLLVLAIFMALPLVVLTAARFYQQYMFKIECTGHLKRAADANVIRLASQEMDTAIRYLEKNEMTSGYTSVIIQTPDEDVGFWYQNLKASAEELVNISSEATQLESSNVLMKLRETLLDEGQITKVTVPSGVAIFPHNKAYALFTALAALMFVGAAILYLHNSKQSFTLIELMIVISIVGILITLAYQYA